MKKQTTNNVNQSDVELRRSTRNTAINKLSTSRKRPKVVTADHQNTDTITNSSTVNKSKPFSVDLTTPVKQISPIKKQLPVIQESPSPCQTQTSIFENSTSEDNAINDKGRQVLVTPKSNKTHSFTENTPFKEDLLVCSQHFDPQSDVAWDCRSPDAINFLKRGRRRRHYSDVSEIVTQLQICKEEIRDESSEPTQTPLLGLWINDDNFGIQQKPLEQKPNRGRRKKERLKSKTKHNNGNDAVSKDLLEKLQLAMEKCEGKDDQESTVRDDKTRSASLGDESRELFDASEINKDEDSWSDDDLFEDDSFIIKATQVETAPKCNKRKLDQQHSYEPPVKTGKFFESQKSAGTCLAAARFTRLNSKPSPFKKHKSFNDRHEYEKSQDKNSNMAMQYNTRQNNDRQSNIVVSKQQYNFSSSKQNTFISKPCAQGSFKQNVVPTTISNCSYMPNRSIATISNSNVSKQSAVTFTKSCTTSTSSLPKQNMTVVSRQSVTKPYVSHNAKHSTISSTVQNTFNMSSGTNIGMKQNLVTTSVSNCVTSSKATPSSSASYKQGINSKPPSASTSYKHGTFSKPVCTGVNAVKSVPISQNSMTFTKEKAVNKVNITVGGGQVSGTRRTSGQFDTSLSDDILCQLVEPDEILDSQIPSVTDNKSNTHIDDALSFFHEDSKSNVEKNDSNKQSSSKSGSSDSGHGAKSITKSVFNSLYKQNIHGAHSSSLNSRQNCPKGLQTNIQKSVGNVDSLQANNSCNARTSGVVIKQEITENKNHTFNKSSATNKSPKMPCSTYKGSEVTVKQEPGVSGRDIVKVKQEPNNEMKSYSFKARTPKNKPATQTCVNKPPIKPATAKGNAMENASEDLFTSDDDELSEPQLLALLDTVESTQIKSSVGPLKEGSTHVHSQLGNLRKDSGNKNQTTSTQNTPKVENSEKHGETYHSSWSSFDTSTQKTPTKSQPPKSPIKCSPEDIDKKRQEALKRMNSRIKTNNNSVGNTSSQCKVSISNNMKSETAQSKSSKTGSSPTSSNRSSSVKQEGLKSSNYMLSAGHSNTGMATNTEKQSCSHSPFKCSQEEIENKKKDALKRLQLKKEKTTVPTNSSQSSRDSSPFKCTATQQADVQTEKSPFKCSPEDIERKKLEARRLKQTKVLSHGQNFKTKSSDQPHSSTYSYKDIHETPEKNNIEKSPFKCSPEALKLKEKKLSLTGKNVPSTSQSNFNSDSNVRVHETPKKCNIEKSPFKCSPEDVEKKRLEAMKRKQQKSASHVDKGQTGGTNKPRAVASASSVSSNSVRNNGNSKYKPLDFNGPVSSNKEGDNKINSNQATNDTQQNFGASSSKQDTNSDSKASSRKESPCKYSQAEIEQKKQAAMQRRLEKMKVAKNLKNSL